ncbi:hypothetical protein CK203_039783 [Vitis vinifera]|uniref:Uncharacterized protein n=1 Tax=Vitis vinifera TaxID=29760 RepID=A0A438HQC5_VITVI|nr:hypothetical protein CK203_039783 [Vitis vinifera]
MATSLEKALNYTATGSYTLKMKMEDESKHQLTCITFNFNIGFGSYVADS